MPFTANTLCYIIPPHAAAGCCAPTTCTAHAGCAFYLPFIAGPRCTGFTLLVLLFTNTLSHTCRAFCGLHGSCHAAGYAPRLPTVLLLPLQKASLLRVYTLLPVQRTTVCAWFLQWVSSATHLWTTRVPRIIAHLALLLTRALPRAAADRASVPVGGTALPYLDAVPVRCLYCPTPPSAWTGTLLVNLSLHFPRCRANSRSAAWFAVFTFAPLWTVPHDTLYAHTC